MKTLFILIGLLIYMFVTTSTAPFLGITTVGTVSSFVILSIFVYSMIINQRDFNGVYLKQEYFLFVIFVIYSFLQLLFEDFDAIKNTFFFIVVPIAISLLIRAQNFKTKKYVVQLILVFFFAECALTIYERFYQVNFFPYEEYNAEVLSNQESWMFRSTAFLGHPLNNALAISTILGFIITSKFSNIFKFLCISIGFLGLLCVNARGATIIWVLIVLYYYFKNIKDSRMFADRLPFVLLVVFFFFVASYMMYYTDLGGRLTNQEKVIDGSAMTRIEAFTSFNYLTSEQLMLGNFKNYQLVMSKLTGAGIENSYIVMIVKYGIIIGSCLIIVLYSLVKKYVKRFKEFWIRAIILASFVGVGSLNNSLVNNTGWFFFLICINSFPYYNNFVIKYRNQILQDYGLKTV